MAQLQRTTVRNRLLGGLPAEDFGVLQDHLEPVDLELRTMVIKAKEPIQHVYFPENSIASVIANTSEGRIEVGLIGREGMAGLPVVLGIDHSPYDHMIQARGEALRILADDLRAVVKKSPSLYSRFMRYSHPLLVQASQTAYANAAFTIEARLARWILMTHDRTDADGLALTHEFLSMMLGVRRPGVTVAIQVLEGDKLIRAKRGRIVVLNRAGLEEAAGDAYGLPEAEYERVMAEA